MARWQPSPTMKASFVIHGAAAAALTVAPQHWPMAAAAVIGNQLLLTAGGLWPRASLLGPNVTRLPAPAAARNEVALTIDDGPHPEVTPRVLDLLDDGNAKATFFCIGTEVVRHGALAREIVARGHGIENHSEHHLKRFAALGPRRMRAEVERAQQSIFDTVGRVPRFFRATAGLRNPFLEPILAYLDLRLVSWTRRPFDTRCGDAELVIQRLTRGLAAGDILLMHDGNSAPTPAGRPVVLDALPRLLAILKQSGLKSATLEHALDGGMS